jgi:hypothetical protein
MCSYRRDSAQSLLTCLIVIHCESLFLLLTPSSIITVHNAKSCRAVERYGSSTAFLFSHLRPLGPETVAATVHRTRKHKSRTPSVRMYIQAKKQVPLMKKAMTVHPIGAHEQPRQQSRRNKERIGEPLLPFQKLKLKEDLEKHVWLFTKAARVNSKPNPGIPECEEDPPSISMGTMIWTFRAT